MCLTDNSVTILTAQERSSTFKLLGPEPAFGRLGLGGIVRRVQFSWVHFSRLASRLRRSARRGQIQTQHFRSKTVTNGVPRGAPSGPKPLRTECQGEPLPVQNRYEWSAKGSPLRSKTVTNKVPKGAPSGPKPLRTECQG